MNQNHVRTKTYTVRQGGLHGQFGPQDIVYISGPITGMPDHNHAAFDAAEELLTEAYGCKVLNPTKSFNRSTNLPRKTYMREDMGYVLAATGLYMLAGWEYSKGAQLEYAMAKELELPILFEAEQESVAAEADRIVEGARRRDYGHPADNMRRISAFWTTFLEKKLVRGAEITGEEAATMMILLKIAREMETSKRDNYTDVCGWAKVAWMVHEHKNPRPKMQFTQRVQIVVSGENGSAATGPGAVSTNVVNASEEPMEVSTRKPARSRKSRRPSKSVVK